MRKSRSPAAATSDRHTTTAKWPTPTRRRAAGLDRCRAGCATRAFEWPDGGSGLDLGQRTPMSVPIGPELAGGADFLPLSVAASRAHPAASSSALGWLPWPPPLLFSSPPRPPPGLPARQGYER